MDDYFNVCLDEAKIAYNDGDVPIGAVIVNNGNIISRAHNTRDKENNVLGHAEINAILLASTKLGRWNLNDCELYVSLKPCSMCLEIIKQSRIDHVYYILDKLNYKKEYDRTILHKINSQNERMYADLLSKFFKNKR